MTRPRTLADAKANVMILLEYRGLCVLPSSLVEETVVGFGWRADVALLRKCTPVEAATWYMARYNSEATAQLKAELLGIVDEWWARGEVDRTICASTDGIPWEIHAINDPVARHEAYVAFNTARNSSAESGAYAVGLGEG